MKVEKITENNVCEVKFLPETEEEKLIMGSLRNHYFFGSSKQGTFPKYNGIRSEDNFVVEMSFKYNEFE